MNLRGSSPILPAPGVQPGSRRFVAVEQQLVNNGVANVAYGDVVARFRMTHPSARLHGKLVIGFEPLNVEEAPFPQSGTGVWVVDMWEWNKTSKGRVLPGNPVIQGAPAPLTYEAVTMSDQWRGTVTVPNLPGTGIQPGTLWLIGSWEPAAGDHVEGTELQALFGACHIQTNGITTSQLGGGG